MDRVERQTIDAWIEAYRRAWETANAELLGEDGRCVELREYWQLEAGRHEPPEGWGE